MLDARVLHWEMAPKPLICSVATIDSIPSFDMTCRVAVTDAGDEVADALDPAPTSRSALWMMPAHTVQDPIEAAILRELPPPA